MNWNSRLVALTMGVAAASGLPQLAKAVDDPVTRAEVKAETRQAEKEGKLTPAGQGPVFRVPRTSEKTRSQRKAETLAARRSGTLEPAGPAAGYRADRELLAQKTTANRAARKAQTRDAERAGTLIPAGEGPGAPSK